MSQKLCKLMDKIPRTTELEFLPSLEFVVINRMISIHIPSFPLAFSIICRIYMHSD